MATAPLPASEYEKEIRALYRERNTKTFGTPGKTGHPLRQTIDFLALLALLAAVSIAASVGVYIWLALPGPLSQAGTAVHTVVAQPELADEYTKQLVGASAIVFPGRAVKSTATLTEQSYLAQEALGQALVLSSDGWLVTSRAVANDIQGNYVVVPSGSQAYPVTIIAFDPVAPLTYLKIEAKNLTATPFASANEMAVNSPVIVVTTEGQSTAPSWYLRYLANIASRTSPANRADLPVASEILPDRLLLDQALPQGSQGAPVVNLQGQVIGLVIDYANSPRGVLPLFNLSGVIESLFSEAKAKRPFLGVTYVQSSWLLPANLSPGGAVLAAAGRRAAVVAKSPAEAAGLKAGDSIVAVEGERLNLLSLSAVLQRYRPGTSIELTIDREGKEQIVNLTLGEVVGESYQTKTE